MITDKDARALVANMREIADTNDEDARQIHSITCWREHCKGRADAYRLAAKWLQELISEKETQ